MRSVCGATFNRPARVSLPHGEPVLCGGDRTQAAAEIGAGAAFLRLEAGRHDATNKTGLEDAAKHLDDLAAGVTKGTVKSPKELDDAFVRADLALARHYHQVAEASVAQNEHEKTGYWLEGTADSSDDGAEWSGHKLAAGGKAVVNGARSLMFIATVYPRRSCHDLAIQTNVPDGYGR